jgi:hypothetical protein
MPSYLSLDPDRRFFLENFELGSKDLSVLFIELYLSYYMSPYIFVDYYTVGKLNNFPKIFESLFLN